MIHRIVALIIAFFTSLFSSQITVNLPKPIEMPATVKQISLAEIEDYELICNTVMAEAGSECYEGQIAVTQCIKNACERENKPFSAIYLQYGYKYQKKASEQVKKAVRDAYLYGIQVTGRKIIVYYNPSVCKSAWHESQIYVCTIGNHKFFEMRY